MTPELREATLADADRLARAVVDGVAGYASFAPPGWTAPPVEEEVEHLRALLGDERVWCLVAEHDGELVGQVTIMPAAIAPRAHDDPSLAHLRNLFVRTDRWGTGLASALASAAAAEARRRGFEELRLFVAEGQARARRFYEREGWRPVGEPFFDPVPGLTLLEYRSITRRGGRSG